MFRVKLSEFADKLVLLFVMLVFVWVGISAIREAKHLDSLSGQDRPLLSEMTLNALNVEAQVPVAKNENWVVPTSQERGLDWVFDVFTPPVIYYDPISQEFAVTPPRFQNRSEDQPLWANFELELIEVRLRPYRLQLVAYVGEPGNYVAYFENVVTGELLPVREGSEIVNFEARLIAFKEQQIEIIQEDSMPVVESVGVARLFDYATNSEISLTNLETKMFSDLEARVRVVREGEVHLVKTGSRVELNTGDYIIGVLSAQPEEALITKISKDGSRRYSKTLTPITKPQGRKNPPGASPFAIRPFNIISKKPQS